MATLGDTRSRARVDKLLTGVSLKQILEGTIANQVLTQATVKQQSGLLGKYDKSHLRIEHDLVGGETPYPRIATSVKTSDRYHLEKHGLSGVITEEDRENDELPFEPRTDKTQDLTDKIMLGRELALSTTLTDSAVITEGEDIVTSADRYDDYTSTTSTPLEDFRAARKSIYDKTGKVVEMPGGFAIVPWQVFDALKFHPNLIENIKHTVNMDAGLTFDQLKNAMGVSRILIPWAQYNNSVEGQADAMTAVWGNNIVFGYSPAKGSKRIETLGFDLKRRDNVRVFRKAIDDPPNAEKILVDIEYDFFLTNTDAAYLIENAIS